QGLTLESLHVAVRTGDLLIHKFQGLTTTAEAATVLLQTNRAIWKTLADDQLARALGTTTLYVVTLDGLTATAAVTLDRKLVDAPGYVGAIEIDLTYRVHWDLYQSALMRKFRM